MPRRSDEDRQPSEVHHSYQVLLRYEELRQTASHHRSNELRNLVMQVHQQDRKAGFSYQQQVQDRYPLSEAFLEPDTIEAVHPKGHRSKHRSGHHHL